MFPNPQNEPPMPTQHCADFPISCFVRCNFRRPERHICFRHGTATLRASMPKATVNEYRNPLSRKDEIGFPEQLEIPPPTFDAIRSKDSDKPSFGRSVPATSNGHHVSRALLWSRRTTPS